MDPIIAHPQSQYEKFYTMDKEITIYLANVVNYTMIDKPITAYSKGMLPIGGRKLFLASEGDIVITALPISHAFKHYVCNLTGVPETSIETFCPIENRSKALTKTLSEVLLEPKIQTQLRNLLNKNHNIALEPMTYDLPTLECAKKIGARPSAYQSMFDKKVYTLIREITRA